MTTPPQNELVYGDGSNWIGARVGAGMNDNVGVGGNAVAVVGAEADELRVAVTAAEALAAGVGVIEFPI